MSTLSNAKDGRGLRSGSQKMSPPAQKTLKNTYIATGLGLLLAAFTGSFMSSPLLAGLGVAATIASIIGMFVVMFIALYRAEKPDGLFWYLGFTSLMGAFIGGAVNLAAMSNPGAVFASVGGTAILFIALSAYTITTKRDLNHWGGFLFVALLGLVITSLINIFLQSPLVMLVGSAIGTVIFSMFIMYDTSRIVNGYETSYVRGSLNMFLNIINLFIDLLQLALMFWADD